MPDEPAFERLTPPFGTMTMMTRTSLLLCLLLVAHLAANAQQIRALLVKQDWLIENLQALPSENAARADRIRELFEKVGCKDEQLTTQLVKRSRQPNVICTLPGETDQTIVVGAHFDKVKAGKGIADNGTGMVLLPALYMALTHHKQRHTFVFAAYTDEELGLVGSRAHVRSIPKEDRPRYRAMVNIDTLGLGPTTVWEDHADPKLLQWFEQLGGAMKLKNFQYVNVGKVGNTDSSSFRDAGIPVIDFHSITPQTWEILHSDRDNMEAIKTEDYFESYRLIAYYLAYLDTQLSTANSPPK